MALHAIDDDVILNQIFKNVNRWFDANDKKLVYKASGPSTWTSNERRFVYTDPKDGKKKPLLDPVDQVFYPAILDYIKRNKLERKEFIEDPAVQDNIFAPRWSDPIIEGINAWGSIAKKSANFVIDTTLSSAMTYVLWKVADLANPAVVQNAGNAPFPNVIRPRAGLGISQVSQDLINRIARMNVEARQSGRGFIFDRLAGGGGAGNFS